METLNNYLAEIFEARHWNIDAYYTLVVEYGPALLIALACLVIGKLLIGRVNLKWSNSYKNKGKKHRWSEFLAQNNSQRFIQTWKDYLAIPGNKQYFLISLTVSLTLCLMSAKFIAYNSGAIGNILYDPIMAYFKPVDLSIPIFIVEYIAMIAIIFHVTDKPAYFTRCIWAVAVLMIIRSFCIYFIPLNPPHDMIFLKDPLTQFFFGDGVQVANDLFFSGHVSMVAFFYFIAVNRYVKLYLFLSTIAVAVMLVWQHVHYSYDVLFAPLVSYAVYKIIVQDTFRESIQRTYKKVVEAKG